MSPPPDVPPSGEDEPQKSLNFGSAVAVCLRKTVQARGRASREEFWYFVLFLVGMGPVVAGLGDAISADVVGYVLTVAYLLLFVPLITAGIRRLHDTGRGGEWWLWAFFPAGLIILVVMWSKPGQPHPNEFGGDDDDELRGSLWG
jgi:uncharacterized membrane protein YhaH (DUF805 family)